jgi:hypothetical protein
MNLARRNDGPTTHRASGKRPQLQCVGLAADNALPSASCCSAVGDHLPKHPLFDLVPR